MPRFNRKAMALVAALALVVTALVVPAASTAKGSAPFKIVAKLHFATGNSSESAGNGTVTIGNKSYKATASGKVVPPEMITKWTMSGGSVTTIIKDGGIKNGVLSGHFKLKGTGKFKNISGSGKLTCPVSKLIFTFKGTASL